MQNRIGFIKFLSGREKSWLIIPVIFLALNIFTKIFFLASESLYGDEAYSIYNAQKPITDIIDLSVKDQNPPGFLILLHYWLKMTGVSAFLAKSLSLIFSVLCSICLLIFSRKFLDKNTAIFVSILFLLSNNQLFYSHEVRCFALVQFLCIISFYMYFELIQRPTKIKVLIFSLVNLLLLFSHYLTIFIPVVQFLSCWFYFRTNKKFFLHYIGSSILSAFLFLPWLKVVVSNMPKSEQFWLAIPNYETLKYFIFQFHGDKIMFYIYFTIIAASMVLVFLNIRHNFFVSAFKPAYYFIFFMWYALPIALEYIISQYSPVFLLRYFLYSTMGLYLLVSYTIANLKTNYLVKTLLFSPLLILSILSFNAKPKKEDDWRALVSLVKSNKDQKSIVFVSASYKLKDFCFYYDLDAFKDYDNMISKMADSSVFIFSTEKIGFKKIDLQTVNKILLVESHAQFEDPVNRLKTKILSKNFIFYKKYNFGNSAVTLYLNQKGNHFSMRSIKYFDTDSCDIWKMQSAIIEKDTIIQYTSNLTPNILCPKAKGVVLEPSISDEYIYKVDKNNPFTSSLTKEIKELNGIKVFTITAKTFSADKNDAKLVFSIENDSKVYKWEGIVVTDVTKTHDNWATLNYSFEIPEDIPNDCIVKIYFWNPSEIPAYIDDLKILLSK